MVGVHPSIFGRNQYVQAHARGEGVGGQLGDRFLREIVGGVKQVDWSIVMFEQALFHGGDKGSDSNARANPDLARLLIFKIKASVRPFDGDRCANQTIAQTARMVTQGLGNKSQVTVIGVPRRSDGVGVRPFFRVGAGKDELSANVPRLALAQGNPGFQNAKLGVVGE